MTTINFEIERVSGRAKVIRSGQVYPNYTKFAKASGYPDAVDDSLFFGHKEDAATYLEGKYVTLLAKGMHEDRQRGTIYVVESENGERFLFGEKGLEIIEKETVEMPEMTYVKIAEPFGEHVRDMIRKAYAEGYEQARFDSAMENIAEIVPKETPQAKRDRIVEQAKADVAEILGEYKEFYVTIGGYENQAVVAKFHVNAKKRTVVALIYGRFSGKLYEKGIAKCAPGDCFNVHIGKAIALRRALGLEVPAEYLNAPAPTEVRVGDIVKYPNGRIVEILEKYFYDVNRVKEVSTGEISSATTFELTKIIDDSREGVTQ